MVEETPNLDDLENFVHKEIARWEKRLRDRFPEQRVVRCAQCECEFSRWTNNKPEIGISAVRFDFINNKCPYCAFPLKDAIITVLHN